MTFDVDEVQPIREKEINTIYAVSVTLWLSNHKVNGEEGSPYGLTRNRMGFSDGLIGGRSKREKDSWHLNQLTI